MPLRLEVGPRDLEKGSVALARRDVPGREGKSFVPQAGVVDTIKELLADIQSSLLEQATAFREANTHLPADYGEFKEIVAGGWALNQWCNDDECEATIKEETKATVRCLPLEQEPADGVWIHCGRPATTWAYFARAY